MSRLCFLLGIVLFPLLSYAAYFTDLPTEVKNPDGTVLNLYATGDEFYNRLHDKEGYTVIQSATDGYYYYAQSSGESLVPSSLKVGLGNPASRGLVPNLNISSRLYQEKARTLFPRRDGEAKMPPTGTVYNVCILIRFADQTEFETPRSSFDYKYNATADTAYSQRNYYAKCSTNQLDIITEFYPQCSMDINLSYQDSQPRNYYVPYNAVTNPIGYTDDNRAEREQTMLANAINAVASQIPTSLNIDADDDNYVDNVCFVIRGPHTAWANLIWAHKWSFYWTEPTINGLYVGVYTLQPEDQNEVRTICHETFHSIGAPDLYHYTFDGLTPVGVWDIMEAGSGHMSSYMKWRYGSWIPAPFPITTEGVYTVLPSNSLNYQIPKVAVSGSSQYFVMEYRKKNIDVFEAKLPGSGLLVYRINPNFEGNAYDGDEVYLYRPGGTQTANGSCGNAPFSSDYYRSEFNDWTNPRDFLSNNSLGHININAIGSCEEGITFHYSPTNTGILPVINITSPQPEAILTIGDINLTCTTSNSTEAVSMVKFFLDDELLFTDDTAPYTYTINANTELAGYHNLKVQALTSGGASSTAMRHFRIIDPTVFNWFKWTTDTPVYEPFGRGAVPIQVGVDFDLGSQEYYVEELSCNLTDDPWGDPQVPGQITASINRFSNNTITSTVLDNFGSLNYTFGSPQTFQLHSLTPISGKIAVVLNLYEYQNILFDRNGISGHSWLTEPDRPWTDAFSRGAIGAAEISLKVRTSITGITEVITIPQKASISIYPNPIVKTAEVKYYVPDVSQTKINVYNLKGQLVRSLVNMEKSTGTYNLVWDGNDNKGNPLASGIYFLNMKTGRQTSVVRKCIVIK